MISIKLVDMTYNLKMGSHVSMKAPNYFLGSVQDALAMNEDAFMIYTGAPQNTRRTDLEKMKIEEAKQLLKENGIAAQDVIIHAPYIVNLANTENPRVMDLATEFLRKEIDRTIAMGAKIIVLHPGSALKAGAEAGIAKIVEGLNSILKPEDDVIIALETMAGKGSEVGRKFEELAAIIDGVKLKDKVGVCLDTCHIHDAGYDIVNNLDGVIEEFDKVIGLDKLAVLHINDSKNVCGAGKDRHSNIGFGHIGFETLVNVCHHPKFDGIVKILETPFIDGKPPYKEEIENIKAKKVINKIEGS